MKTTKTICLSILLVIALAGTATAQKKQKKKDKELEPTILKLYEGPELPREKVVHVQSVKDGKKYAYFIAVDEVDIPNHSLMNGPQEILLLPGDHKIRMRFVSPGEIAIPIEPFDNVTFEAGKSYSVKLEHTAGSGSYLDSAGKTRIRLWIEETGQPRVLAEKTVNGFGRAAE